jgi:hypothetical protein
LELRVSAMVSVQTWERANREHRGSRGGLIRSAASGESSGVVVRPSLPLQGHRPSDAGPREVAAAVELRRCPGRGGHLLRSCHLGQGTPACRLGRGTVPCDRLASGRRSAQPGGTAGHQTPSPTSFLAEAAPRRGPRCALRRTAAAGRSSRSLRARKRPPPTPHGNRPAPAHHPRCIFLLLRHRPTRPRKPLLTTPVPRYTEGR